MNFRDIFWGVILIVIGALFAIRDLTDIEIGKFFLPVILITAGGMLLVKNNLRSDR